MPDDTGPGVGVTGGGAEVGLTGAGTALDLAVQTNRQEPNGRLMVGEHVPLASVIVVAGIPEHAEFENTSVTTFAPHEKTFTNDPRTGVHVSLLVSEVFKPLKIFAQLESEK